MCVGFLGVVFCFVFGGWEMGLVGVVFFKTMHSFYFTNSYI